VRCVRLRPNSQFGLIVAGVGSGWAKLSKESIVVIGARVLMHGDVMLQQGDFQGWSAPVTVARAATCLRSVR